jgi:hypothetical protein
MHVATECDDPGRAPIPGIQAKQHSATARLSPYALYHSPLADIIKT